MFYIMHSLKHKNTLQTTDPFALYQPVIWTPRKGRSVLSDQEIYSTTRDHGIDGSWKLCNLNDSINDDRDITDKIIINYKINDLSYPLFTGKDLVDTPYPYDIAAQGNILGEIAERIARRVMKNFLRHCHKSGKTGGIFDKRFDPKNREDFIVGHTNDYILKIQKYPNLIILKRTGHGKYGYENIKELDGFFDYRFMGHRHILVLESKLDKINVNCDDLINNLFSPLRELFPEAKFYYVLFSDTGSIYVKNNFEKKRQLRQLPVSIYKKLHSEGIGTLFFTFNESRENFETMKNFLMLQYRTIKNLEHIIMGKTIISDKELIIFDGGETPHIKLVKDTANGFWREVQLHHKK